MPVHACKDGPVRHLAVWLHCNIITAACGVELARSLSHPYRLRIGSAVAGSTAQQMRIVARAGSAPDHREGEWVSVQPAHSAAEALPQWTARHASVLWLCVRPGAIVERSSSC